MIWLLFQTKSFLKGKANRQIFERGDYYFLCCSQSYRLYLTTASISKPESVGGGLQSFPFLFIYRQNHFKNNNLLLTVDKSHLMSTVHILKNLTFRGLSLCYCSEKDLVLYLFTVFVISISLWYGNIFWYYTEVNVFCHFNSSQQNVGLSLPATNA